MSEKIVQLTCNHPQGINAIIERSKKEVGLQPGGISDGYHTFDELYEFRKAYNAALFNEWALQGKYNVHKSFKHEDGEYCFGEPNKWFIVVTELPAGQISNHYKSVD